MYRVELKVDKFTTKIETETLFLMYRVELKAVITPRLGIVPEIVPNVPCGVERARGLLLM